MASLPPVRMEEGEPFEAVGVDLFGAFQVNPAEPYRAMARHISVSEKLRGTFRNGFLICRYHERVEKCTEDVSPRVAAVNRLVFERERQKNSVFFDHAWNEREPNISKISLSPNWLIISISRLSHSRSSFPFFMKERFL